MFTMDQAAHQHTNEGYPFADPIIGHDRSGVIDPSRSTSGSKCLGEDKRDRS